MGGGRCCGQVFRIPNWTIYIGCRSWNNTEDVSEKDTGLEPQKYCIIGGRCCGQVFRIPNWTIYIGCRSWNNTEDVSEKETGLEPQKYCIIGGGGVLL